ncbi:MAG: hypothetical protein MJD61_04170 [Proteobacteria bacterium]|nr:hypothetical protein [Pseudomonadota bacterium]
MGDYIRTAKPDLISFDSYWFGQNKPSNFRGSRGMAEGLLNYRRHALAGVDGAGMEPIAFGQFTQGYRWDGMYTLTESQIRLYYFMTWTYGGRWLNWFRWLQGDDEGMGSQPTTWSMLLENGLPRMPSEAMGWTSKANQESRNWGPYLVRLKTTDIRFVAGAPGTDTGTIGATPAWDQNADPYLRSISGSLLGPEHTGQQADLYVGYFQVIPAAEGGDPAFFRDPNAQFFMITNGFTSKDHKTAHDARQQVTLEIDLGGNPPRFIKQIDRQTGLAQMAPVTALGGGRFRLVTELPGGTGALYMLTTSP